MDYATGYRDGFAAGMAASSSMGPIMPMQANAPAAATPQPRKRKVSAYSRAYGRAYKSLRRKATLKSGKLRKGVTHKKLVKQAHAQAKRGRKK